MIQGLASLTAGQGACLMGKKHYDAIVDIQERDYVMDLQVREPCDEEIDRILVCSLSITNMENLKAKLRVLNCISYAYADYRQFGEHLVELTMPDLQRLEGLTTTKPLTDILLDMWQKKCPGCTLGDLRRVLQSITRHDVDDEVKQLGLKALLGDIEIKQRSKYENRNLVESRGREVNVHRDATNSSSEPDLNSTSPPARDLEVSLSPNQQPDSHSLIVHDPHLREMLRPLVRNYTPSLDGRVAFYCRLFLAALVGLVDTIHCVFRSAFYDPIDYSSWSIFFYIISRCKEWFLYLLMLTFIPLVTWNMDNGHIYHVYRHIYLFALVLVQIIQDKSVSFTAKEMRRDYILAISQTNLMEMLKPQVEERQKNIKHHLQLFLIFQGFIFFIGYVQFGYVQLTEPPSPWNGGHIAVSVLVIAAFLGKVAVYICHYRYVDIRLLHGRFKVDGGVLYA